MKPVKGGTFTMGALPNDKEADADEVRHQVTLKDYYIGETEVTQELWEAIMPKNRSKHKGPKLPVEYISYDQCKEFIQKLNKLTGRHFRLPTEAEWEYAARGGQQSKGYLYAGSNKLDEVAQTFPHTFRHGATSGTVKAQRAWTIRYVGQCMGVVRRLVSKDSQQ